LYWTATVPKWTELPVTAIGRSGSSPVFIVVFLLRPNGARIVCSDASAVAVDIGES